MDDLSDVNPDDTADLYEVLTIMGLGMPKVDTMPVNGQPTQVVNEAAVYVLVFESRAPKARAFKRWIRGMLLPLARAGTQPADDLKKQVRLRLASAIGGEIRDGDWVTTFGPGIS
jgi:prophage antirepressor-like protein